MNEIKELFEDLDRLFSDVAALIRDCDGALDRRGWVAYGGNSTGQETGRSLEHPSWWYPGWVSRHYLKSGLQIPDSPMLYVAVLLHDRPRDDLSRLQEPVVTAGHLRFPPGTRSNAWYAWMAKAWVWQAKPRSDGVFRDIAAPGGAQFARAAGWALGDITSGEKLDEIVEALVDDLNAR